MFAANLRKLVTEEFQDLRINVSGYREPNMDCDGNDIRQVEGRNNARLEPAEKDPEEGGGVISNQLRDNPENNAPSHSSRPSTMMDFSGISFPCNLNSSMGATRRE
jgi:hypothetical protein